MGFREILGGLFEKAGLVTASVAYEVRGSLDYEWGGEGFFFF